MARDYQDILLGILHSHFQQQLGQPYMSFSALRKEIETRVPGKVMSEEEFMRILWSLREKKEGPWVDFDATETAKAGSVRITSAGMNAIGGIRETSTPTPPSKEPVPGQNPPPEPARPPDYHTIITHGDVLGEIRRHLAQEGNHFILLRGERFAGKTYILERAKDEFAETFVPCLINIQAYEVANLNGFLYALAMQLSQEFEDWAKKHGAIPPAPPNKQAYQNNGQGEFDRFWQRLRLSSLGRRLLLLVDEIEHLLVAAHSADPQILAFLGRFISNHRNGCFIVTVSKHTADSERENKQFGELIEKAAPILVRYYPEEAVRYHLQYNCSYDNEALEVFVALCDGIPGLMHLLNKAVNLQVLTPRVAPVVTMDQLEQIADQFVAGYEHIFPWLFDSLSPEEQEVLWLISRVSNAASGIPLASKYPCIFSGEELRQTASRVHRWYDAVVINTGLADLVAREWLQQVDLHGNRFRLRIGIISEWLMRFDRLERVLT